MPDTRASISAKPIFWKIKRNGRPSHQCGGKWRRKITSAVNGTTGTLDGEPFVATHTCMTCWSYFRAS